MTVRRFPLVAVSQRVDVLADRNEVRDALDQQIAVWLARAGTLALPVPNALAGERAGEQSVDQWMDVVDPALVLLSGGNDIGDAPWRDATETAMLDWARRRGRPVLGLCRGMQMMGVFASGTLVPVTGHVRTHHDLGAPWPGRVNSYHEFGFIEPPPGYRALSRAQDGTIEAMRHETLPWEGWMWHPERGEPRSEDIEKLQEILRYDQ